MATDRTYLAVKRQLDAMGCPTFELGVKCSKTGKMLAKVDQVWSASQILATLGRLRRQNAQGAHVYVRPAGSTGLLLIDDLTIGELSRLESDGLLPACVVETSPLNYQAWIRVGYQDVSADLATAMCQVLAKRYGGDPNSADWRHFGRLAGFTNRKPQHVQDDGRFPFVILRQTHSRACAPAAPQLMDEGRTWLTAESERPQSRGERRRGEGPRVDPDVFYKAQLSRLAAEWGDRLNLSIADWRIVGSMVESGYQEEDIWAALEQESPDLWVRKKGHVEDYLKRTIDKKLGRR